MSEPGDRAPEPAIATCADERTLLVGWLQFHRDALASKCAGLSPEELARRSVAPSALSLLGLVRHLTEMERVYLGQPLTNTPWSMLYCTDDDSDGDFESAVPDDAAADIARWRAACGESDAALAPYSDLGAVAARGTGPVRWLVQKLIGEYARHNGHADLLREAIDGAVGE